MLLRKALARNYELSSYVASSPAKLNVGARWHARGRRSDEGYAVKTKKRSSTSRMHGGVGLGKSWVHREKIILDLFL